MWYSLSMLEDVNDIPVRLLSVHHHHHHHLTPITTLPIWVVGRAGAYTALTGQEAGHTLDRLTVHHSSLKCRLGTLGPSWNVSNGKREPYI